MNIIVAVDKNWAIGCKGKLLYKLPLDMQFFKKTTINKTVVVGRKTLESFPNKGPLPNRLNIVLSTKLSKTKHCTSKKKENLLVIDSLERLDEVTKDLSQNDIYIIGGETIYKQLLHKSTFAYVTKINTESTCKENLNYFNNLDLNPNWQLLEESPIVVTNNIEISFCKYKNLNPLKP